MNESTLGNGWRRQVAGAAPGLQSRCAAENTVAGGFDSHTPPPLTSKRVLKIKLCCVRGNNAKR